MLLLAGVKSVGPDYDVMKEMIGLKEECTTMGGAEKLKFKTEKDRATYHEILEMIENFATQPKSLQWLACNKVRSSIGPGIRQKLTTLNLPTHVKEMLLLKNLEDLPWVEYEGETIQGSG